MRLLLTLQRSTQRPKIAEELATKIKRNIVEGRYRPNEPMPTVKQLATDLGISESTAIESYNILKREEVTVSSTRGGTQIAEEVPTTAMLEEYAQNILSPAVERCREVNIPRAMIERVLKRSVEEWFVSRGNDRRRGNATEFGESEKRTVTRRARAT